MSVQYCSLHDHHYDSDFVLGCKHCLEEKVEILRKLEEGEIDIINAAEDLRERGASNEEIEEALGLDSWRWIRTIWKQQEARRGKQS